MTTHNFPFYIAQVFIRSNIVFVYLVSTILLLHFCCCFIVSVSRWNSLFHPQGKLLRRDVHLRLLSDVILLALVQKWYDMFCHNKYVNNRGYLSEQTSPFAS